MDVARSRCKRSRHILDPLQPSGVANLPVGEAIQANEKHRVPTEVEARGKISDADKPVDELASLIQTAS